MKKALRYNELDELAWERQHGCYDEPELDEYYGVTDPMDVSGDVCWDEVVDKMVEEEYDEPCDFENGIMGSDIRKSHECNEFKPLQVCVSTARVSGLGKTDDILSLISTLLEPDVKYHYEFRFFKA